MIDLLTTRTETPEEIKPYAHLLAAVIAQAVEDLAFIGSRQARKTELNIANPTITERDVIASLVFLWGRESVFPLYAKLIGLDAEAIRLGLLGVRKTSRQGPDPRIPRISEMKWSIIRRRLHICGITDECPRDFPHEWLEIARKHLHAPDKGEEGAL